MRKQGSMDESSYDERSDFVDEPQFQSDGEEAGYQNDHQDSSQMRRKKQQLLMLEEKRIKSQLKQIPFGELVKYRKLKQQTDKNEQPKKQLKKDRSKKQQPSQKKDKNAPKQIKIMRRPPKTKLKTIFESDRAKSIDPRFEDYAGSYNPDLATKSYSFIKDIQQRQVTHLKKQIKSKRIGQANRQILMKDYNRITNDIKRFEHQQLQKKVRSQFKHNQVRPKKRQVRQQVQRQKLSVMDSRSQDKRLKKKQKKIQKQRMAQRRSFINNTK